MSSAHELARLLETTQSVRERRVAETRCPNRMHEQGRKRKTKARGNPSRLLFGQQVVNNALYNLDVVLHRQGAIDAHVCVALHLVVDIRVAVNDLFCIRRPKLRAVEFTQRKALLPDGAIRKAVDEHAQRLRLARDLERALAEVDAAERRLKNDAGGADP